MSVAAVVMMAAALLFFVAMSEPTPSTSTQDETAPSAGPDTNGGSPTGVMEHASENPADSTFQRDLINRTVLPDASTPLALQLDELDKLSAAGSGTATCRLLRMTSRCQEQIVNSQFTRGIQAAVTGGETAMDDYLINLVARDQWKAEASAGFCEGLSLEDLPSTDAILSRSSQFLSLRQRILLVLTQSDGSLRRVRRPRSWNQSGAYVLPQYIADNTERVLLEGFRARDPLALEGLVVIYGPGSALSPLSPSVWLPNPRKFLLYATILVRVKGAGYLGWEVEHLVRQTAMVVGRDEVARIEREAEIEASHWPKGVQVTRAERSTRANRGADGAQRDDEC